MGPCPRDPRHHGRVLAHLLVRRPADLIRAAPLRDRRRSSGRTARRRADREGEHRGVHHLLGDRGHGRDARAEPDECGHTRISAPRLLLTTVTTVVIGGVSLFGGQGSVIGVLGGVLVLSFLNELFDAVQVNALYQQLIQGLIILTILGIYRKKRT